MYYNSSGQESEIDVERERQCFYSDFRKGRLARIRVCVLPNIYIHTFCFFSRGA